MDLPLLVSGFSSLATAFLVGAVWATRQPPTASDRQAAIDRSDITIEFAPKRHAEAVSTDARPTAA